MKTRIVEKSSGTVIATESNSSKAIEVAIQRRGTSEEIQFVVGEPDVLLHTFASKWAEEYSSLSAYYRRKWGKEDIAEEKLDISTRWRKIAKSRLTNHEDFPPPHISTFIGLVLASEIELLIRLGMKSDATLHGPVAGNIWSEAYRSAGINARRDKSGRTYVVAHHDFLGIIVAAPVELITGHPGFRIIKEFVGKAPL